MTPDELRLKVNQILHDVTPATSLSATRELVALGLSAAVAFQVVCQVIEDRCAPVQHLSVGFRTTQGD